ncbi:hypothetical protein VTK73DRAFT_5275 [Phialemonium thermophilum]|uniref:HNH nuclease domain-containing protein n=1 Tax=Phialemonium thermophilum TaxID=223376 RepID=A0ABR3V282_9PEZI
MERPSFDHCIPFCILPNELDTNHRLAFAERAVFSVHGTRLLSAAATPVSPSRVLCTYLNRVKKWCRLPLPQLKAISLDKSNRENPDGHQRQFELYRAAAIG